MPFNSTNTSSIINLVLDGQLQIDQSCERASSVRLIRQLADEVWRTKFGGQLNAGEETISSKTSFISSSW
jgi:hypothetical protein